jgi:3-oxoacyl-[acyl-carrier-protein] synthase III
MTTATLYLSEIGYALGAPVPITAAGADSDVSDQVSTLRRQGVGHYLVSASTPSESAARSCRPGALTGSAATSAVVYCTDSPSEVTPTDDLWDFMCRAGVPEWTALISGGGGCGNLGPGLQAARGLLATKEYHDVLLVTTDRVVDHRRYVAGGMTVLSDSAASCLVSRRVPDSGFRVTGLATTVRAGGSGQEQGLASARSLIAAINELIPRAFRHSSAPVEACRYLLTGNFGHTPRQLFAMAAGMEPEAHYAPRVGEIGHCFSADILIGLADLAAEGKLEHGDQLMLVASSPRAWSVVAVDYHQPS